MYAYVALTVYGEIIPGDMFEAAVRDFRVVQRVFYSPTGGKRALVGRLERLVRPHSFFQSMSHRPVELRESAFDNREHRLWKNPFTGELSTAGFWDLFSQARELAEKNIAAFDRADFNLEDARGITRDLDFSGEPTQALVVSVENGPAPEAVATPRAGA